MRHVLFSALLCAFTISGPLAAQDNALLNDPVAQLQRQLDDGRQTLQIGPDRLASLAAVLERFGIRRDSQVLVFAKDSLQAPHISPSTPRSIYFSDDMYVASVPGGDLFEVVAIDPAQGPVFYTLAAGASLQPRFERRITECTSCHGHNPARLVVTSVTPAVDGSPFLVLTGTEQPLNVDHRTPLEDRWGGWYVTGTHGSQRHKGNAVAPDILKPFELETNSTQNRTSLADKIDLGAYLEPTSDIVALMVLEHQARVSNLLTALGRQARARRPGPNASRSSEALDRSIEQLVTYMTSADEAPLREPVQGVSTFTRTFPQRGPRDARGRSLRDFDQRTRIFRYPLSYMVYSAAFDTLPDDIRARLYQRFTDVLGSRDPTTPQSRFAVDDRRAALDILRDTKPDIPAYPESAN